MSWDAVSVRVRTSGWEVHALLQTRGSAVRTGRGPDSGPNGLEAPGRGCLSPVAPQEVAGVGGTGRPPGGPAEALADELDAGVAQGDLNPRGVRRGGPGDVTVGQEGG